MFLFSLVRLQLLLCLDFELKCLLDFVGGRGRSVCLREEGSRSWSNEPRVLQDGRANVEYLRIGEVKAIDVEDGTWLDVLLTIADHLSIACLGAADGLLAELMVLLCLVRLETK